MAAGLPKVGAGSYLLKDLKVTPVNIRTVLRKKLNKGVLSMFEVFNRTPSRRSKLRNSFKFLALLAALILIFSTLFTIASANPPDRSKEKQNGRGYSDEQLLVKFKPGTPGQAKQSIISGIEAKEKAHIKQIDVHVVKVPESKTVEEVIEVLERNPNIEFVEPDYFAYEEETSVNDYWYPAQWGIKSANAPKAWDITTGASEVLVAVVDTGIKSSHPDLTTRVVAGYDFVNGDSDPTDDRGHGTAVAGVIVANTNNSIGIAGANWNSKVLAVKVLDSSGWGTYSNIAAGIIYAADHGAKIINLSLGGTSYSSTLKAAVDYAFSKGCVLVAAAGNSGDATVNYPAGFANVIAVGAVSSDMKLKSFSCYGEHIDVVAPGSAIAPTINDGYADWSGTSFSAPFVSGLASLVLSLNPSLLPQDIQRIIEATAVDLGEPGKDLYFGSGFVDFYAALTAAGGLRTIDGDNGSADNPAAPGNQPNVVDDVNPEVAIVQPSDGEIISGRYILKVSATDNTGIKCVRFYLDGNLFATDESQPYELVVNTRGMTAGIHHIFAEAEDIAGNKAASTVVSFQVAAKTTKKR